MKQRVHGHSVRVACVGLGTFALLVTGCSASSSQPSGGGGTDGAVASDSGGGTGSGPSGTGTSSGGTSSGTNSSGSGTSSGGTSSGSGTSSGGTSSGSGTSSSGGTSSGGGMSSSGMSGAGDAGTAGGTDASTTDSGMITGSGVATTVDLIGPGPATCGATNATHGDGFICVLNYPNMGANVVGYWFDYPFSAGTCSVSFTKPAGNSAPNPQVCFSASTCAVTSGGGLGLALCDVHGINVSMWPQLMMLETTSSLSTTMKSPFSGCNPGAKLTAVSWTVGSGSIPAGTSVLFDDAADVDVARVDGLAAGATSVTVPAGVDTSKVASIKFSVAGASSTSWNFCLTSLKVSLQ